MTQDSSEDGLLVVCVDIAVKFKVINMGAYSTA